jgi:protein ImuA
MRSLPFPARPQATLATQKVGLTPEPHGGLHASPGRPTRGAFTDLRNVDALVRLRQALAKLETGNASGAKPAHVSLGVPELHDHLPGPGLACGVLHEAAAATHADKPAALGFILALAATALRTRPGPAIFVAPRGALTGFGQLYGHGLAQLGVDVGRLLLIEPRIQKDALWALEEALRSEAAPAVVSGVVEGRLDLTVSRRLNLAAAALGTPLFLLRSVNTTGASAAATRWRIGAAAAARDRFGTITHGRWQVALERCRNGRLGQWCIEWNHVAHRFSLVEGVADRAPVESTGLRQAG